MQYAIINGRTHELLAGITFYSIYSHLNWVGTLMQQWCTAMESCPPPGWPPQAVQMGNSAAGGWSEKIWQKCSSCTPLCRLSECTWTLRKRWRRANDHRWCGTQAQHRAEATHVETCVQTCTNSFNTYCCAKPRSVHADVHPHGANYLN